jgi:hypothetical protein
MRPSPGTLAAIANTRSPSPSARDEARDSDAVQLHRPACREFDPSVEPIPRREHVHELWGHSDAIFGVWDSGLGRSMRGGQPDKGEDRALAFLVCHVTDAGQFSIL